MFHPKDDLKRSQVRDLCRRSCQHKGCRASCAHSIKKPLLQKRYSPSAAGIKRYANGSSYQYSKSLVASEKRYHKICRHITLKQSGKKYAKQKINPRSFYIPPQIFQIPQDKVWIRIPAFRFLEAIKIEKWPVLKKIWSSSPAPIPQAKQEMMRTVSIAFPRAAL